jgi:DNA-directed RNA polymerase specialized sigma24 family protein
MHEAGPDVELLRAAFRDVHGARLHGFALVLTLGDRHAAGRLTADTFAALAADAPRLRHPERAAAALRAELLRRARRLRTRTVGHAELQTLATLGVDAETAGALARLSTVERAAILASHIERFGDEDAAVILGIAPARARQLTGRARRRYVEHHPATDGGATPRDDSIVARVHAAAARAMGAGA